MTKHFLRFLLANILIFSALQCSYGQQAPKPSVAVLLPLHLDSLFGAGGQYKFGSNVPKFTLPALEFYNGVQLAADSLRQEGVSVRIEVVDTRKPGALLQLLSGPNAPGLLIGVMQGAGELKQIAEAANQRNIPFISATYPNDGGITANPNLLIVNSTLKSHCQGIYKYLQRNHGTENIVVVSRSGAADDRIRTYLLEAHNSTASLKLQWKQLQLGEDFDIDELTARLDSNRNNVVVCASLSDDFSQKLIRGLSSVSNTYTSAIFGMPTWDEYNLAKPEFKGVDVYFTTAFVSYSANARVYQSIQNKFKKIANSRPSDMVFKGFETTYRFIKTFTRHSTDFQRYINGSESKVFADFNFEPVRTGRSNAKVDYYENKKLYFVRKVDGAVKAVL